MLKINQHFIINGIGPRSQMQDAGLFRKLTRQNQSWCIVCDGIGGQPGGAEAANICVSKYDEFLSSSKIRTSLKSLVDFLKFGLLNVIDAFYTQIQNNQSHQHMGCTLALVFIENEKATFCWIGDSRIYLFRKGKVHFKSIPHNPSFDAYRDGKISLRQAEKEKTNIITRGINADSAFPILETKQVKLHSGDRILVCTDGVWNKMEQKDLINLASAENLNIVVKQLNKKLKAEAEDNYWAWAGEIN